MNKEDILKELKKIKLNKKDYIVICGSSLVMQGIIEETPDIDLSCSKEIYDEIDWEYDKILNKKLKVKDIYSISPTFYDEDNIVMVDGYKCMNLEKCLEVKKELNRPKDKKIIEKLDLILAKEDNYRYERKLLKEGYNLIAGVDEVGRGPLVGPVVTAAVILPPNYKLEGLTDSKKLTEKKRNEYYNIIMKDALAVSIGIKDAKVIDEINIYEATKQAMYDAINKLSIKPEYVLIDAMKLDELIIPHMSIIKGDFKSMSIAAASVIAKVTRDSMMYELGNKFPEYGFEKHKGYPTKEHIENVKKYGLLDNYRFTFSPVSDLIKQGGNFEKEIRKTNI